MRIKVYLDEDVPFSFSQALLLRSVDVVTTQQGENKGLSDKEQLVYAIKEGRCIFTHNKRDFILLNNEYLREGKRHTGIILSDQLPTGILLKRFMKLWFSLKPLDVENRLEFLSNWK
jgi:predicted nuclease of predicted toxin-antitoxin system